MLLALTLHLLWSIIFIFCVLALEGMNAIVFWGEKGRGQESTTYSENISVIKFYLSTLTLHLLWSIIFIFCVLALEGMNAIVFGEEKGEKSEDRGLF